MQTTITLSDFLEQSGATCLIYDMGRGIRPIDARQFRRFEEQKEPYPFPLQQHAWLALLGNTGVGEEGQFIWFLKFPLDEQGLLIQGTRDEFMVQLLESHTHSSEDASKSPYGFKPRQSVMAAFHAIATHALKQKPSRFYEHARDYLKGEPGYDQWAFVGIQGIADVAARLDELDNRELVQRAIPQLPPAALVALCGFLENVAIDKDSAKCLQLRLQQELDSKEFDLNNAVALLHAFSRAEDTTMRNAVINTVLQSEHAHEITLLAAIAARNWESLHDETLAHDFCEAMAENNLGHDAFIQVMADLLYLPGMRAPLLAQLRSTHRSAALAEAVGAMFNTQI